MWKAPAPFLWMRTTLMCFSPQVRKWWHTGVPVMEHTFSILIFIYIHPSVTLYDILWMQLIQLLHHGGHLFLYTRSIFLVYQSSQAVNQGSRIHLERLRIIVRDNCTQTCPTLVLLYLWYTCQLPTLVLFAWLQPSTMVFVGQLSIFDDV